jgi:hypothetical protein
MLNITRSAMALAIAAAVAGAALSPTSVQAQAGSGLPSALLQQLQAPNANVQQVSQSIATSNPGQSTAVLQASIGVLGGNTEAAANEVTAFADLAATFVGPGAGHNPALAAALAVAIENIVGDPQNAALVNGPFAAIIAAAKAKADATLADAEVQQAILDHAPGTENVLQAAVGNGFGGFGAFGNGGGPSTGNPNNNNNNNNNGNNNNGNNNNNNNNNNPTGNPSSPASP